VTWHVPSASYSGATPLVITGALDLLTAQRKSMAQAVGSRKHSWPVQMLLSELLMAPMVPLPLQLALVLSQAQLQGPHHVLVVTWPPVSVSALQTRHSTNLVWIIALLLASRLTYFKTTILEIH